MEGNLGEYLFMSHNIEQYLFLGLYLTYICLYRILQTIQIIIYPQNLFLSHATLLLETQQKCLCDDRMDQPK